MTSQVCMLKFLQTFWLIVFAHWLEKPCSQWSMVGDQLLLACQWCQCFCLMEGLDMSCKYHFFIIFNRLPIQQEPVTSINKLELCIFLFHCLITIACTFLLAGWLFVIILFLPCLFNNLLSSLWNALCTWNVWNCTLYFNIVILIILKNITQMCHAENWAQLIYDSVIPWVQWTWWLSFLLCFKKMFYSGFLILHLPDQWFQSLVYPEFDSCTLTLLALKE